MLVCLLAGNYVVGVIERPLRQAKMKYPKSVQVWTVYLGTNRLWTFPINTNQVETLPFGTNLFVSLQLEPVAASNDTFVVQVRVDTNAPVENSTRLPIQIIAQFVFPALKMKEKKYVYRGVFFGGGLFALGITFCYFLLMPVALSASVQYAEWLGFSASQWRAEDFITFVCRFMLGMGLGFELPVVLLVLVKIGVLDYRMLAKARRYVIIMNFFLGAVLTTPEIITQVLMAVPLQILYEITVWIAWYWERQDRKRQAALDATGGEG
jgi:sec-independent protein translocase protein TatC